MTSSGPSAGAISLVIETYRRLAGNRQWWRVPLWVVLVGYSVSTASGLTNQLAAGVLLGVSAATLLLRTSARDTAGRVLLVLCSGTGLAACYFVPAGLAEVPILASAARAASVFDGLALRVFTALDAIAFAATIAVISRSLGGALAGIGVPLLVQRSVEQRELVRERDRAQALLAEAQRGRESAEEAAALSERGRIAREMHDVLAHSLAGLSVQLQGVRAIGARDGATRPLLTELDKAADLAREGLREARAVVGTLRDPVGLGLADVPALVERHPGQAGLDTIGAGSVTPGVGHAVYRAVQESLTNAARYAPGSTVVVTLSFAPDILTVTVADSGPGPGRSPTVDQGTGLGLAGMTERVERVGGTMQAGPRPDGGWTTTVRVPTS